MEYPVYPRVCGGTILPPSMPSGAMGLSPRVRGNRMPHRTQRAIRRVYPRVCGGTRRPQGQAGVSRGLSPRVRGNRGTASPRRRIRRSIPACAGEPMLAPSEDAL